MSKARRIIENLFEAGPAPVAPPPTKPHQPLTTPGKKPKHDPWRRRDTKPGTAPKPKAFAIGGTEEEMTEAKKAGKGKVVAKAPGRVSYGKKKSVKESLARRLLDA